MTRWVVLLAALLAAAPAWAQEDFTYVLTGGAPGEVTLRREGEGLRLTGRLDGRDLDLRGERHGDGWRFVLPGTPGITGVLAGREAAGPRVLVVRRAPGDVLEGRLEGGGAALVSLRGARKRAPVVPAECAPTRDRWWSRHGVATWELGRSLWDFFKPGSRRLEELRGPMTQQDARGLRTRLERLPAPWTPEMIYAEARAMTSSPREALQLAFALTVDHVDLPLAQLPGIDPREPVFDKYAHFFGSAILAHRANATGSFTVGWLKEVMDRVSGGEYSHDDLMADALGAEFGQRLQCGE
ncbi:MAG: hypothetical protein M9894_07165 [Planctomycetes bacterium]|nr:hypothetical protein [Planctomycetota bacterium]